jgi:8-oxo-dGTP pyrophosphatase MutT (NUDIX family)/phosphohistidine phosphatase SixA
VAQARPPEAKRLAHELSPKPIRAAGGVVWRPAEGSGDSAVEVAIVHRPRYDDWSIPKGKLAAGESELDGALREVHEETGYRVRPGRALGDVQYLKTANGDAREKVVHYWAMQAIGGAFTASREVDELRWLSLAGSRELVTRQTDREILERFESGPVQTTPVLLVRHASAGSRAEWEGDDHARPLDDVGHDQAQELVRMLSRFEIDRIVSADNLRCIQTLKPLGDSIGLPVEEEPLLSEQGYPGHEAEATASLRGLAEHQEAVAACSQQVVIPDIVRRLAEEDGAELPDPLKDKKASFWALSFDGPKLYGVEYFPPPDVG